MVEVKSTGDVNAFAINAGRLYQGVSTSIGKTLGYGRSSIRCCV
jgi:hypothetical protein